MQTQQRGILSPKVIGGLCLAVALSGCTGVISGERGEDGANGTSSSSEPALIPEDGTFQPFRGAETAFAKTRVWQLTPLQYETSVERTLGVAVDLSALEVEGKQEDFTNQAGELSVGDAYYATLEESAQALVEANSSALEAQLGCTVEALDQNCLSVFLNDFGARLLRAPGKSFSAYLELYTTLRTMLEPREAFQGVVTALLLSPKMLFRTELGSQSDTKKGAIALSQAELAENLAFSLWNAPPDAALLTAAQNGALATPQQLEDQVARMLATGDGSAGVTEFLMQWLGLGTFNSLEKNQEVFPEYVPELQAAMLTDTQDFIARTLALPGVSFDTLLTQNDALVDTRLASLYGVTPATTSLVTLPQTQRRGILTRPAVIAAMSEPTHTGVIYRGKVLLRKLLCIELTPPDTIVVPEEVKVALASDATTRERVKSIELRDGCNTCHTMLHPMALAMENYDTIGRYRDSENGQKIDASGSLAFTEFTQQPFQNAVEMIDLLAGSEEVHQCFVRQAFRYLSGRREELGDDPTLRDAFQDFRSSRNMATLVTNIVVSETFRTRQRP